MVNIIIDGKNLQVAPGTTILNAAKEAGIRIPTLCYLKEINEIAACRVCVVEVKGVEKLVAACNTPVSEGMEILTNSPKVRKTRKTNVELILAQHNSSCTTCSRNGNCDLQSLCAELGINNLPYKVHYEEFNWDENFPLIRDASKCIKCMRCVQVCDKVQNLHVWDVANTGSHTTVKVKGGADIKDSPCSLCGQCIVHCPVGALSNRNDIDRVQDAIADEEKITVFQIAPAVRGAWGAEFGMEAKDASVEKLVSGIRALGVDYVFDTSWGADLTIMEEGSELLERISDGKDHKYPMFTSCCPGWVRFIKSQYPEMVENLSSAKSPHQMQGAVIKSYFAGKLGVDPSKLFVVSIMPCVSKKSEINLPGMEDEAGNKNVDAVLTTRELSAMFKADRIDMTNIKDGKFDSPLAEFSGAGVIFGVTGGVMEAALRTAYFVVMGKNPPADAFKDVRGDKGWREASFDLNGKKLNIAVVSGLGNTRKLIESLKKGAVKYDFVEVMACPNGCVNGGGQPIKFEQENAASVGSYLYDLDMRADLRYSHENADVQAIYKEFLEKPLSHKSHELLHVDHFKK